MDPDELDRMSKQVQDLSGRRLSDIRVDLLKTKSVELTVNRIFDGSVCPYLMTHSTHIKLYL